MSSHDTSTVQRYCDVCIVGGSAAGLAAALQLGRQRRSVIVVDAGQPRNAPAAHMHSYLSRESVPPSELAAAGRQEVRSYGGEILADQVTGVTRAGDFAVGLASGHTIVARRVLAATGVTDELPEIDGLAGHWGRDVFACPFCHGYEFGDQHIVQILSSPAGLHTAALLRHLTAQLTIVLHHPAGLDSAELDRLRDSGVTIIPGPASRVVAGSDGRIAAVELAGGRSAAADAVVVLPRFRVRAEPFAPAGLQPVTHASGLGDIIQAGPGGVTTVPGLYAAGTATDPGQQVLPAAASGSLAGAAISISLASEDVAAAARPSASQADWDHRYGGDQVWSGNPNGTLVTEASGLAPGRALDVGAGEGGDALWLAEQGWTVTASDISERGLERVSGEASRRGLAVSCMHADANALGAFPAAAFDLVSAHYASIPRSPDSRAVLNLLDAVAPGGTLLIVSHDLEPVPAPGPGGHRRPFDPDAYVRVGDFAAALEGSAGWDIELHGKRPRPAGAVNAAHHTHDIVLRARRHAS